MELADIRREIDEIDREMTQLFVRRMKMAKEVSDYKRENHMPVLDKSRERAILGRVSELAGEELARYARSLYGSLLDISRAYQRGMLSGQCDLAERIADAVKKTPPFFPAQATVACQGVEGAYSQQACDRMFSSANILYFNTFDGVFSAVEQGLCRYGVLPIENSSAGSVAQVYNLMEQHRFYIVRGARQRIDHALLARPGARLDDIREVWSHQQGIAQCSRFLKAHPEMQITQVENTAIAAKRVAESGRGDVAAIASERCAGLYGLQPILNTVSDAENNFTRFICISRDLMIFPGSGKISMSMSLAHEPGSLYALLSRFAALGVNLTKLESRPIAGREFEFRFHFDIEGSVLDPEIVSLLCDIAGSAERFTFLGNYLEVV